MANRFYARQPKSRSKYPKNWGSLRQMILNRDNHRCQIRLPGCTDIADQVDHIQPISAGGNHDPANLRASCQHCNRKRVNLQPKPSRVW